MTPGYLMVLIHLSGALERVRLGGVISPRVVNTIAWHLSGLNLFLFSKILFIINTKYSKTDLNYSLLLITMLLITIC